MLWMLSHFYYPNRVFSLFKSLKIDGLKKKSQLSNWRGREDLSGTKAAHFLL